MVAFNSTRRHAARIDMSVDASASLLVGRQNVDNSGEIAPISGSRRSPAGAEIVRDGAGNIIQARIGRWRVISASADRRIADVQEMSCGRLAIRLLRCANRELRPSCEMWQLYDVQGRLLASLQRSGDGGLAILTDYQSRQASRLAKNRYGELEVVESWSV